MLVLASLRPWEGASLTAAPIRFSGSQGILARDGVQNIRRASGHGKIIKLKQVNHEL